MESMLKMPIASTSYAEILQRQKSELVNAQAQTSLSSSAATTVSSSPPKQNTSSTSLSPSSLVATSPTKRISPESFKVVSIHPQDNIKTPLYRPAALRPRDYPAPAHLLEHAIHKSPSMLSAEHTRGHWKPDAEATRCALSYCGRPFTFFERKHHCRKCGEVVCSEHCDWVLRLTPDLEFSMVDDPVKGCENCGKNYQAWLMSRNHSMIKGVTPVVSEEDTAITSGVPHDWSWSTF
jgi:hypothetical protein